MLEELDKSGVVISLGAKGHQLAETFSQQQAKKHKVKEVYLNTLAVYAVNVYLEGMGITTNLEASYSWNSVRQTMANATDLVIQDWGRLECCYLLPNQKVCHVSPEVYSGRIGYVVVKLNEDLTQAILQGFAVKVRKENLLLTDLLPLEELLEKLTLIPSTRKLQPSIIKLREWADNLFAAGWQSLQEYFQEQNLEPGFSFRSPTLIAPQPQSEQTTLGAGIKFIKLEKASQKVALVVSTDLKESLESTISIKIFPLEGSTYLPQDLQLIILSEAGDPVVQTKAKTTKQIEVEFSGEKGEKFSVKVVLDNFSITETFLI